MNMKLSNTLLISKELLPSYNKAFTLAEVLITLTILGVVAAITIPSLINRQSEVAAKTKLKKAIANYENIAAVYMAEYEAQNLANAADGRGLNANYQDYFKIVSGNAATNFKTSDGAYWAVAETGDAIVCDAGTTPKFCVQLWAKNGRVNTLNRQPDDDFEFVAADMPDAPCSDCAAADGTITMDAATFMNTYTSNQ